MDMGRKTAAQTQVRWKRWLKLLVATIPRILARTRLRSTIELADLQTRTALVLVQTKMRVQMKMLGQTTMLGQTKMLDQQQS
jgi:hypothetical protein